MSNPRKNVVDFRPINENAGHWTCGNCGSKTVSLRRDEYVICAECKSPLWDRQGRRVFHSLRDKK